MIKVALLQCKSGAIAAKNGLLALSFFAHSAHQPPNPLCLNSKFAEDCDEVA